METYLYNRITCKEFGPEYRHFFVHRKLLLRCDMNIKILEKYVPQFYYWSLLLSVNMTSFVFPWKICQQKLRKNPWSHPSSALITSMAPDYMKVTIYLVKCVPFSCLFRKVAVLRFISHQLLCLTEEKDSGGLSMFPMLFWWCSSAHHTSDYRVGQ